MSEPVRLAVLDSGVFAGNAHMRRPVQGGVTLLPEGERDGFEDTLGHGTAVCALLQEMAPEAELFSVKIFDRRLSTTVSIVLRAIDWCVEHRIDIINLSLGTTNEAHRPLFLSAIERVRSAGAVLVSAYEAGGATMLPGSLPGVVGVVEDASCPRDEYRVLAERRFAGCPFPLDIAGVPRERNLRGVSFAVAHLSARIARAWPDVPAGADWVSLLADAPSVRSRAYYL